MSNVSQFPTEKREGFIEFVNPFSDMLGAFAKYHPQVKVAISFNPLEFVELPQSTGHARMYADGSFQIVLNPNHSLTDCMSCIVGIMAGIIAHPLQLSEQDTMRSIHELWQEVETVRMDRMTAEQQEKDKQEE